MNRKYLAAVALAATAVIGAGAGIASAQTDDDGDTTTTVPTHPTTAPSTTAPSTTAGRRQRTPPADRDGCGDAAELERRARARPDSARSSLPVPDARGAAPDQVGRATAANDSQAGDDQDRHGGTRSTPRGARLQ